MCSACFVFFPGPRTDNQCVLCVFVFFLTKLSNLDTAKPPRISCVFVFPPTDNRSQWPCVLCVFVSFYQSLIWPGQTRHVFCVFLYFSQVQGQTTNVLYVFLCFSYKTLKFRHGKTPTCFLCFCIFLFIDF